MPTLKRLLTYLNVLIALILAVCIGAVYWFVYRVLPMTSGTLSAPITAEATVTRDSNGVPHIKAASIEEAIFLQGYITAQDRLWQMDALRRFASGELSEVVGRASLETDRETRKLRTRRIAEQHARTIPPEDRRYLAAYARGVNHFIETHLNALPLEFTILRYDPKPWTIIDCILTGIHMYRDLTTTWKDEIAKATMLARGDPKLVNELWPMHSGQEFSPGSNAWALSGKLTASGKPILASDPHLDFAIPSTWYMIHLQAPGLNVSGVSLPGAPSVIIGHNDRIAWGVTNLHYDVQDLYFEQLNTSTGQYLFAGQVEQARAEQDYIRVKGSRPVEITNWVTRHGPVWTTVGGRPLTLRWMAAEAGFFEFPMIQLNRARNWDEFKAAVARFPGPGQNFVYADVEGNVGYHASGKLPIRRNHSGDIPTDGSSGQNEWDSVIPFDELPQAFNPDSGLILTANQNPFPPDYKYRVNGNFAPHYRSRQIRDRLMTKKGWKPEEMLAIQKDVYSGLSHFLARQVVAAHDKISAKTGAKDSALVESINLLRSWNGQMEKGTPAPVIISLFYQHLRNAMVERAAPSQAGNFTGNMAGPAMERILRERPSYWFDNYDALLANTLAGAIAEGKRTINRNPISWDYGVFIRLNVRQPVGTQIPVVGPYFNIGPVPMSGSTFTVKQTTQRIGPSMRFIADLSNWDQSLNNITIGQSGQFLSPHYKDQWDEYYVGKSLPMRWTGIEGKVLRFVPEAEP
jgi:penicillin G amidase